ncbi:glycosyltransferase family 2 protein [Nocardioides dongkuii]|uniref:glycosyltransferase family 2 protein n=1 Tax=Nocardioides dongkuii TaxID=2760089 RepID=UPI0015F7A010|nr:glycosyltransferase family A protein [Nocardioides dongkuii]
MTRADDTELVSVLVPAFNHERHIVACLDSVAAETWSRLELVVIDDASTDGTYAVAKEWAQSHGDRFERVVVLRNEVNAGVGATLNRLLREARGCYITTLASDDLLVPGGIPARIEHLRTTGSRGAVIGDCWLTDDTGLVRRDSAYVVLHGARKHALAAPAGIRREVILNWSVPGPVLLFHRDLIERIGGHMYDETLIAEDRDLYLRLLALDALRFVDLPVAVYRLHGSNTGAVHFHHVRRELEEADRRHRSSFPRGLAMMLGFVAAGRRIEYRVDQGSRAWKVPFTAYRVLRRAVYDAHSCWTRFRPTQ